MRRLAGFLCLLVAGCGVGQALPPAFTWVIYNRTDAAIAIGPASDVPACSMLRIEPGTPTTTNSALPSGVVDVPVKVTVPAGYSGVVSVVVTSAGATPTVGGIDASLLPLCAGQPPR